MRVCLGRVMALALIIVFDPRPRPCNHEPYSIYQISLAIVPGSVEHMLSSKQVSVRVDVSGCVEACVYRHACVRTISDTR